MNEEVWRPIPETLGNYEVSNHGRVRSIDHDVAHHRAGKARRKGRILKQRLSVDDRFFVTITIDGKPICKTVHRLVAKAFLPPSDLPEVNHIDLDHKNNRDANLEWMTRKENAQHAQRGGLFNGATNPKRRKKLTTEKADCIRRRRMAGEPLKTIASDFGISIGMVSNIALLKVWV